MTSNLKDIHAHDADLVQGVLYRIQRLLPEDRFDFPRHKYLLPPVRCSPADNVLVYANGVPGRIFANSLVFEGFYGVSID
jgi:hypothetical protein